MNAFTESVVEQAALDWFRALGYDVVGGPDMPPGPHALRESYADTFFPSVMRGALARLNPNLPTDALDDVFRKLTRPEGSSLEARNRAFHRLAVDGVTVEYRDAGGSIRGAPVWMFDFEEPSNNDWLAVIELKNPADEDATVRQNVTIDWTLRENVRANLRRLVRRILRKHGYPPDKQEKATRTVLEQAEALSAGWAA